MGILDDVLKDVKKPEDGDAGGPAIITPEDPPQPEKKRMHEYSDEFTKTFGPRKK